MAKAILAIAMILGLAAVPACGATTITAQAGNYRYKVNEPIEVIDIETRNTFGILTITGVEILKDEPFEARESAGEDENGEPQYTTVTYSQIVQIFFTYTGEKKLSDMHFNVRDATNELGRRPSGLDPVPAYQLKERSGQSSFVVALKNKGSYLEISFIYNAVQIRPTARIRVEL